MLSTTDLSPNPARPAEPARFNRLRLSRVSRLSPRVAALFGLAAVGVAVVVATNIFRESPPAFLDLDVYRRGVRTWWNGGNLYGPMPAGIAHLRLPFTYPPFAVLFLSPLAALPWVASTVVTMVISVAALATVIHVCVRRAWPRAPRPAVFAAGAVVGALSLATEPVQDTLWFGQVNLVLMLLVTLDCLLPRTFWPRGLLVGIAAATKLTPVVFLLFFLLRKDFRSARTAAVSAVGATAVGFVATWHGSMTYWFGTGKTGARFVSGDPYASNQTIDGLLARLVLPHGEQNAVWMAAVGVVLLVAALGIRRAHLAGDPVLALSLTAAFGLLASPTSWGHHWVYVVPGMIAMGSHAIRHRSFGWAAACAATVGMFVVAPWHHLPGAGTRWIWWQHLVGNGYVILVVGLMLLFLTVRTTTRPTTPAGDRIMAGVGR